ncbi:MAG: hypothetical protein AAF658_19790, partial [Myxococcota bacterium]
FWIHAASRGSLDRGQLVVSPVICPEPYYPGYDRPDARQNVKALKPARGGLFGQRSDLKVIKGNVGANPRASH